MMMVPFKIVKPLMYHDKTYMAGQESRLRMYGFSANDFCRAILEGKIVPAIHGEKWYTGPHKEIFYEQGFYTEQSIRNRINSNTPIYNIGKARRKQVLDYLNKQVNDG